MSKDNKRTPESKATTAAIRTVRQDRKTEQRFTDRQFNRLMMRGLS